jgi:16S rRNA (guanine966-N2)-methyltransferase
MPRNHRSGGHTAVQNKRPRPAARGRNEVRIIGGRWRGRKIRFPDDTGIRPSPDRVRETLFNWLAPAVRGARCLDLFAGSGVLGLEALSRGAATAILVDRDRTVVRHLQDVTRTLDAAGATVIAADALDWLAASKGPFDIVFLDPPFDSTWLPALLGRLDEPGCLAPGAWVYVERPAAEGPPSLPAGWRLHRSGKAGDVGYYLAVRPGSPAGSPAAEPTPAGRGASET